jgi:antitoxin PrlF
MDGVADRFPPCEITTILIAWEFPYIPTTEGEMSTSKVTSNGRTIIPQSVRTALRLRKGDKIAYVIEGERVILTKAVADHPDDPFGTFSEWDADVDRRAYADLSTRKDITP